MERTVLGARGAPYSQGLKVAGKEMVFVSGQLSIDEKGAVVAPGNLEEQARHAFRAIEKLLKEAGGTLANVVKITAFITTLDGYQGYGKVRRELFGETFPTSSTVQVTALVVPGCLIEIEAIAVL